MVSKAVSQECSVNGSCMRSGSSLLMSTRLYLVFTEENALPVNLLKGNICRGKIIVVDSKLVQSIHGGVS